MISRSYSLPFSHQGFETHNFGYKKKELRISKGWWTIANKSKHASTPFFGVLYPTEQPHHTEQTQFGQNRSWGIILKNPTPSTKFNVAVAPQPAAHNSFCWDALPPQFLNASKSPTSFWSKLLSNSFHCSPQYSTFFHSTHAFINVCYFKGYYSHAQHLSTELWCRFRCFSACTPDLKRFKPRVWIPRDFNENIIDNEKIRSKSKQGIKVLDLQDEPKWPRKSKLKNARGGMS